MPPSRESQGLSVARRRGVASVVGTIFFVLVFMMALGSLAYASGLQQEASSAQEVAIQGAAQKGSESLEFAATGGGLVATNEGPAMVSVNHIILRYPNGTVYSLPSSVVLPSGGATQVQSLIPAGICSPGSATCDSKYLQILTGNPAGSSVGLVTGEGNTFWYTYQDSQVEWSQITGFPPPCPKGESISGLNTTLTCTSGGALGSWVKTAAATSGTNKYSSTGLSVPLPANGTYMFYVFTALSPSTGLEKYNFEVHALSAGSSLVIACTPLSYPSGGGNQPTNCVSAAGTPIAPTDTLAFGVSPPVYETPGIFGVVTTGTTGTTLEIDFACTETCGSVIMQAGSFLIAQELG